MTQLNEIVWAKSEGGFWPGIIVRPKLSNLRIWRFNGCVCVRFFQKTTKSGEKLTGWVKEEDVVPFEVLPGSSGFQDVLMQKAYDSAVRKCKISGFIPQFARDQLIRCHRLKNKGASPHVAEKIQKVESQAPKEKDGPSKTFSIFGFVRRTLKERAGDESQKVKVKEEVDETMETDTEDVLEIKKELNESVPKASEVGCWPKLLSSMKSGAESKTINFKSEQSTPKSTKRKRIDEKENSTPEGTPRSVTKVRKIVSKANYIKAEDVTDEMLASTPTRVKDKKKPQTDEDKAKASSCHQCRQKTMDLKTFCRVPGKEGHGAGNLCAICLKNIYGQDIKVVLKDPEWKCPYCQGKCVCSICMKRKGLEPNGVSVREAKSLGFNSVTEYVASGQKVLKKIVGSIV